MDKYSVSPRLEKYGIIWVHICEQSVKKRINLKMSFQCVCADCGKVFSNASTLSSHRRVHNVDKMNCDICNKTLINKSQLKVHVAAQHGTQLYECSIWQKK